MQSFIDEEKLISLVEKNECLYNKFSAGYKSAPAKDAKWKQISEEMGVPEDQCRRRWTTLRDRYSRECRRLDMPSGSGAAAVDSWPYFESMRFLRMHVKPRAARCTFNICKDRSRSPSPQSQLHSSSAPTPLRLRTDIFNMESSQSLESLSSSLSPSLEESQLLQNIQLCEGNSPLSGASSPIAQNIRKTHEKKRKAGASKIDDTFEGAMDAFTKLCKSREARKGNEVVQGFGQMICGLISDMSAKKQLRAMQRVIEIVTEIRLEPEGDEFIILN